MSDKLSAGQKFLKQCLLFTAMFGFFFHPGPVTNFEEAANNDKAKFGRWHRGMLERGEAPVLNVWS